MPVMRAARARRQVYLDGHGHIVVRSPELDKVLYTLEPALVDGAASIVVKNHTGSTIMTISVSATTMVIQYLPVLFNTARRLASRAASTTLPKRATLINAEAVNQHDKED